mmetsp:Transcript_50766/g.57497  ORF Transcript_50766/g.57497 Transcript_50766/m.57497 type:complete len:111 (-) Transcript_50766:362-694(-)
MTVTTGMMEKKKVATQVPSGEEEESGSTVSEPTARQFEQQRWEEGRTKESPPELVALPQRVEPQQHSKQTHPLWWKISYYWTNDTILSHFCQNNHGHSFQCLALSDRKKK